MKGYWILKFKPEVLALSANIATFSLIFEKYIFADLEYAKWLVILMGLDLLTGITKAINDKKAITSYGLRRTITKIIQYFSLLILVHVLTNATIGDAKLLIFPWVKELTYVYLIIIEALSILENINSKGLDLRFIINRLRDYISTKKKE